MKGKKRLLLLVVCAALLAAAVGVGAYLWANRGPEVIAVDSADGSVPLDARYDGPQIVKIRLLTEEPFLEIYWDRYVDATQAINFSNFVLRNGDKTVALTKEALASGSTDSLYFDRRNSAVALGAARCMDRLDEDLHMSSFRIFWVDQDKLAEIAPEGLTLEVAGSAITDDQGRPAKDAVYTGIPQVDYYTQFVTSETGIVVKADDTVAYDSLVMAARQVDIELGKAGTGIAETMRDFGCSLAVYSPHQNAYFLPEHRYGFRLDMYDVEGYGGDTWNGGVSSIAERNILRTRDETEDPALNTAYRDENVLIHEFGHCIKLVGMDTQADQTLAEAFRAAYRNALDQGLWPNTYAISNEDEFFATMCTVWFNVMSEAPDWTDGTRCPVNTREELAAYDPVTYAFFATILPDAVLPAPWDEPAPDVFHDLPGAGQ